MIYLYHGLQIRVCNWILIYLFLNQNICCGYSKELSQYLETDQKENNDDLLLKEFA